MAVEEVIAASIAKINHPEFSKTKKMEVSKRDVMELLRAKEQELLKVKRQVEALRIAAPLLGSEHEQTPLNGPTMSKESNQFG